MCLNAPQRETATSADCLVHQATEAKLALANTLIDVRHDLARAIAPGRWVAWRTWATLGAAAIVGYAAGAFVSRARHRRTRNATIEEAILTADLTGPTTPRRGMATVLAGWIFGIIKFEVGRAIGRMFRASFSQSARIE